MEDIRNKCHLKSGNVTESIIDNSDVVSGLVGCPLIDCSMTDKDLKGGTELVYVENGVIKNIETWHDCGNSRIILFTLTAC